MRLNDKVILVTASTRGIGLAIAKACAREGGIVCMASQAAAKHLSGDFRALFLKHIPLSRIGLPEEIAQAVVYFASDESAYTTGQILSVSGGFGLATPLYGELSGKEMRR